jgi:hypothetical protein
MADLTYRELSDAITVQALKDTNFRKELVADPTATFEKYSGQPAGTKVFVHENSASELHFVLPPPIEQGELSDEDLEKVAGGEFFIGVAIVGAIATVAAGAIGTAATIANDQTKARHGW